MIDGRERRRRANERNAAHKAPIVRRLRNARASSSSRHNSLVSLFLYAPRTPHRCTVLSQQRASERDSYRRSDEEQSGERARAQHRGKRFEAPFDRLASNRRDGNRLFICRENARFAFAETDVERTTKKASDRNYDTRKKNRKKNKP